MRSPSLRTLSRAMTCPQPSWVGKRRTAYVPVVETDMLPFVLGKLVPDDRRALAQIVDTADMLEVGERRWLMVPLDNKLEDQLAAFASDGDDRENDLEDEPEIGDSSTGFDDDDEPEVKESAVQPAFSMTETLYPTYEYWPDGSVKADRRETALMDEARRERTTSSKHTVRNAKDGRFVGQREYRWCTGDRAAEDAKVRRFLARAGS